MINTADLYNLLTENNVNCFCGVPDSLLKDFCAYITENTDNKHHTITANEGNAIGLAAGHYLATGNPALVYMQNSGIGNCVNPLLSLTAEEVYNIPLMMFIGWRGEPGKKDEPQHIKQGKVTDKLLEVMGIKYSIMPDNFEDAKSLINKAFQYMKDTNCPYAFIIRKGTFEKYTLKNKKISPYELKREDAIDAVIKHLTAKDIIVSTTGHISREVYETRNRLKQSHKQDFLTVGSMGHSSSIALGIALEKPDRNIYCFDGDGAFLMHQGAITINATKELTNLKHIVFNNEAHDSVGSQPTAMYKENLSKVALDCGYKKSYSVSSLDELQRILPTFINDDGTSLLEIKVKCGAREDLGRPKEKPQENKKIFMENLNQIEFSYRGAIENLHKVIDLEKANRILVFTGKKSFENIKPIIEKETRNSDVTYYNNFSVNPKKEEIDIAIKNLCKEFDLIVTIGGGSVIDFAKAYKYYSNQNTKLVAIPTTAGTGSEATQFAVVYINGVKTSLDKSGILPEYAIIDSQFVENNPRYLKACTAMDAFCHAIESYWAVKATSTSRMYAKEAMILCKNNIEKYVNSSSEDVANNMMKASNLAGKAINISRTTAAHALSYKITSEYGIPHGHAVALSMIDVFYANLEISNESCNGFYSANCIRNLLNNILLFLGCSNFKDYWENVARDICLELNLNKLNITNVKEIISSVNMERLQNNPKNLLNDITLFYSNI